MRVLSGRVPDLVAATALTGFLLLVTSRIPVGSGRTVDGFGYLLLLLAGGATAWCRSDPRTALGVVTAVLGCYLGRQCPFGPVLAVGWLALLALSLRTDRRAGVAGGVVLTATLGVGELVGGDATPPTLFFAGWSAAAVALGDALRSRRDYLRGLEERARHLEHTREEEARRRVAEERLRIARDLHDSVAHAMATINVQAGAAAHVVDRRPESAKDALAAIRRASGDVLEELAATLALLRDDDEAPDRTPTPGVDQLWQLVAATREAGLEVRLAVHGPTDAVPNARGTAAYRIVQESLTNVLRHAGAATASVTVTAGPDRAFTVEIRDDGAGPAAGRGTPGTGTGIRGMRERAESTDGRLTAGPDPGWGHLPGHQGPGGGFVVRAVWDGDPAVLP